MTRKAPALPIPAPPDFSPFAASEIERSIAARFEAQVAEHGARLAIRADGAGWTYRELNGRANAIAARILGRPGDERGAVALLLPQGALLIAAILGVLKAGRPYLGLDARYPPARLREMIGHASARLVLAGAALQELATDIAGNTAEFLVPGDEESDAPNPGVSVPADALAYIFYTSGSTGKPKAVMDNQRNVLHNVMRYTNTLRISPSDRMTLLQSASFSGSVSSLFGALLNGACCCPLDLPRQTPEQIAGWLRAERVTIWHSVPAIFRSVAGAGFPELRIVRLEGDQAAGPDAELFTRCCSPGAFLVNGLGTTETGLVRQFFFAHGDAPPAGLLPVGQAVADMDVLVLDEQRAPAQAADIGEIAVRSRYLALGYLHDAELTRSRFLPDPSDPAARIYLTGDLGRLCADGCLEHLGRRDSRVKLRGQTVDLAEVEAALLSLPGMRAAAVALRGAADAEPRLVAWYESVASPSPAPGELRRELATRLPSFMVPSLFIAASELPRNENGKIDRRALSELSGQRPQLPVPYRISRNLVEAQLIGIWEQLLGVRAVGIWDDFFDLGGDSLAAMRMLGRIHEDLGAEVEAATLLEGPTVERLAQHIGDRHAPAAVPVARVQAGSTRPFFWLHGDYSSGGFYCRRLAREIGADVSFHALPPCGLNGSPVGRSYGEMAEVHLRALRQVQPRGPYFLGGTCNGGLVAYEIARRLHRAGDEVRVLALFAASAANQRFSALRRLNAAAAGVLRLGPARQDELFLGLRRLVAGRDGDSPGAVLRDLGRAPRELARILSSSRAQSVAGELQSPATIEQVYRRIDDAYVPAAYAGRISLLWPQGEAEDAIKAAAHWRRLAEVDLRQLGASHHACLTTDVAILGREIAACLRAAGFS